MTTFGANWTLLGFTDLFPTVVNGILFGIAGLVVLFLISFVIVCRCEKQHLIGDVEPAYEPWPYPPNPYWLKTRAEALRLGLRHAGDYATARHTSLVKGLESLFFTADRGVLLSVVAGSAAGAKLKKTVLRTQLSGGKILETTDNPGTRDVTGGIDRAVLLNAGLAELLTLHHQRLQSSPATPVPFARDALEEHERIDLERGKRLVLLKLAYWVNPQQSCIRLTWRGAFTYLKDMFTDMGNLQSQQHRTHIRRAGDR